MGKSKGVPKKNSNSRSSQLSPSSSSGSVMADPPSSTTSAAASEWKFKLTRRCRPEHQQGLWCITWSKDIYESENEETEGEDASSLSSDVVKKRFQFVATCGSNRVDIYKVELDNPRQGIFELFRSYQDQALGEQFYCCAYAGRSRYLSHSDFLSSKKMEKNSRSSFHPQKRQRIDQDAQNDFQGYKYEYATCQYPRRIDQPHAEKLRIPVGPQLLCVAGCNGVIQVIDPVQQRVITKLYGHFSEIYDLQTSPTRENQLLSASKDESIRLWDINTHACMAVFTGIHGHREVVYSVGWHPLGDRFASCGDDMTVRLWKINEGRVAEAIQAVSASQPGQLRPNFKPAVQQSPYFATEPRGVLTNTIDCVMFLGDNILCKSIDDAIIEWMPVLDGEKENEKSKAKYVAAFKPPSKLRVLRIFRMEYCRSTYIRFGLDHMGKVLAIGNDIGEVFLWDVDSLSVEPKQCVHTWYKKNKDYYRKKRDLDNKCERNDAPGQIPKLAFSPDGKILLACDGSGCVTRWDSEHPIRRQLIPR